LFTLFIAMAVVDQGSLKPLLAAQKILSVPLTYDPS